MKVEYQVSGMTCSGCARAVKGAVESAAPGVNVEVELDKGTILVDGSAPEELVGKAVEDAGFTFGGSVQR